MTRVIADPGPGPSGVRAAVIGQFYISPLGYSCALCDSPVIVLQFSSQPGLRCSNPMCAQAQFLYELQRLYLPRVDLAAAPAQE